MRARSLWLAALGLALAFSPPAAAQPMTPGQVKTMSNLIHRRLADQVAGYQFALMHGGRVLHERAWGYSNLTLEEPLRPDMRQNLGSISKVLTAITVLKLADRGLVNLDAPFTDYLDPSRFPPSSIEESIHTITVRHLLTMTAHLPYTKDNGRSDCSTASRCLGLMSRPRQLEHERDAGNLRIGCVVDLELGPDGAPYHCKFQYQNAATHLLRYVIETFSATRTTADLVEYVRDLWLETAGAGSMSCAPDPSARMRYYQECAALTYHDEGGPECTDGRLWESDAWTESDFCSSGGWRGSARDLCTLLTAIRNGKVLSPAMTQGLLATELLDARGHPGGTAIGFDPPWKDATGERHLGKNGGVGGARTYVTLLPNDTVAALLLNTYNDTKLRRNPVTTSPTNVLRAAYNRALAFSGTVATN